jgi:type IV pilus assembly protein PilW
MTMHRISTPTSASARRARGFSLTELMVALALGLVLALAVSSVYLFAKSAFTRQDQLASVQQSVRTAFEYLASDARMVGHLGCYTGNTAPPSTALSAGAIGTNYALGIEGYEYSSTGNAFTLASNYPANVTTATNWKTNQGAGGIQTIPVTTITADGLTPGSDVLVIRTVVGRPMRLTGNLAAAATSMTIENVAGGKCSNGTTDKISGFCPTSHGLIASCTDARTFQLTGTAATGVLTLSGTSGPKAFAASTAEVFPLQTIVYYLKRSANGTTTSIWRRTFNGDPSAGVEQELIEGVDSMQVRYGIDTTVPDADGVIDSYVTADAVTDWSRVVAVRMSVLLHATEPTAKDVSVAASGLVNDVTVTYPTSGSQFDRRVFTTTVAIRNKIRYL